MEVDDDDRVLIEDVNMCTICLFTIYPVELVTILPCNHYYHDTCLDTWLSKHNNCPQCRRIVKMESIIVIDQAPYLSRRINGHQFVIFLFFIVATVFLIFTFLVL